MPATDIRKSFCRICPGFCGMDVTVEGGRVIEVRGDRDDPLTRGYTCIKGLQNPDLLNGSQRIRRSMRRGLDGQLSAVPTAAALDEIAAQLRQIVDAHGPRSVGIFIGTQGWFGALNAQAATAFATALETPCLFGTMTIDQSAKWVASERIGVFNGGPQRFDQSDVWMLVGTNPLVSVMGGPSTSGFANINPTKALRDAKARGLKLIVIDPRETETARQADLFLQPRPGMDAALMAAMIHVVLREGWQDSAFCAAHVDGVETLRQALAPFTPDAVGIHADVPSEQIIAAARLFAKESQRGMVGTGTGTDMGPHSNIAEHLAQCLNILCGRFLREGEAVPNPGVLQPVAQRFADVSPPARSWREGPVSRRLGLGRIYGQMMSAELADEMLQPGPGQIKALICLGGNPAVALPDQAKTVAAMRQLDLLVTIDPRPSATARLADYVIAPTLAFERHDHSGALEAQFQLPYGRYASPVVDPPADADVIDDWRVFWELARRMGVPMRMGGMEARADVPTPETEAMLAATSRGSRIPLDQVRASDTGRIFAADIRVQPGRSGHDARLEVAPDDVLAEIAKVAATLKQRAPQHDLLLTVRRVREFMNSVLTDAERSRQRLKDNPAFLHPDEMAERGLMEGDFLSIASDTGAIVAIARPDPTLRRGVVSVSHCWGQGIDDPQAIPEATSRLVSSDRNCQAINGMPIMTAIPVAIRKLAGCSG